MEDDVLTQGEVIINPEWECAGHYYPEDNKFIDSYNYIKGRPEQTQIPNDEVAFEYCLHEKPAVFNRHQFHQVYNPTEQLRVVAHIVYNTESWQKCKELSLIH